MDPLSISSVISSIIGIVSAASQVASSIPLLYGQIRNAASETSKLREELQNLDWALIEIVETTEYVTHTITSHPVIKQTLQEVAGTIKVLDGYIQRNIIKLSHLVPATIRNPSPATVSIAAITYVLATASMYKLHERDRYQFSVVSVGTCALLTAVALSTGDYDPRYISAYVPICIMLSQITSAFGHTIARHTRQSQSRQGEVEVNGGLAGENARKNVFSREHNDVGIERLK